MLHWQSKRNPAFVWKIRTYQEQHGPFPYSALRHPLAMTWMASCVRKYLFPSVLVHPLVSVLRLSALVLATAAAYRGNCLSLEHLSCHPYQGAISHCVHTHTWHCRRPLISALIWDNLVLITIKFKNTGVYNPVPQFTAVSFIDKTKEKYRNIWSKWEGQFEGNSGALNHSFPK